MNGTSDWDRFLDPPDIIENPRCSECDEQMTLKTRSILGSEYICTNPDCKNCDPQHDDQEGDESVCVNCGDYIYFLEKDWRHVNEDGMPIEVPSCPNARPTRSAR